MARSLEIRPARPQDVSDMARLHVDAWDETYRGLVPDDVLDDPEALAGRERQWTAALTDPRYATHRVAVAEQDGTFVGIAMSGPAADDPDVVHLYVLYVLARWHGSGAGARLLEAVVGPHESASLWVADPNPRAQSFYRKQGFRRDGREKVDDSVREVHMTRTGGS